MRIILLTGSELRHDFMRKSLAASEGVDMLAAFCEGLERSLGVTKANEPPDSWTVRHLAARTASEEKFFRSFVDRTPDQSNPVYIPKGAIGEDANVDRILALAPDLLVAYGCSIVKGRLLEAFDGRFLNLHLGLSPYYRGGGTNFFPFVNDEPEYVGVTFMYMAEKVDAGEVIHQIRPRIGPGDMPVDVGNQVIADAAPVFAQIIRRYDRLVRTPQIPEPPNAKTYFRKHQTEEAHARLYENLANGMIDRYLADRDARCARVPIVTNPALS